MNNLPTTLSWQASAEKGLMAVASGRGVVVPTFSVNQVGLVPAPLTVGTTRFLREDGTWGVPPGTGVSSFNGRTGAVTLTSSDVTTALTYTPANVTALANYLLLTGGTLTGNLTFSGAFPTTFFRDTDLGVSTGGLWLITAANDTFQALRNTAVAGDFSTYQSVLVATPSAFQWMGNLVLTELGGSIPTGTLSFGSATRQMLNLWNTSYGIGIQNNTQYYRTAVNFAWYVGGTHATSEFDPGSGGSTLMRLTSAELQVGQAGAGRTRQLIENNGSYVFRTQSDSGAYARGLVVQNNAGTRLAGAGWLGSNENSPDQFSIGWGSSWWDQGVSTHGFFFTSQSGATYLNIRGTSPTVWWHDTNERPFAIHVNGNTAYFMRGNGVGSASWETVTSDDGTARWPFTMDLVAASFNFAGKVYAQSQFEINVANSGNYAMRLIRGNASNWGKVLKLHTYEAGGTDGPQIHFIHDGVVEWGFGIQPSDGSGLAMYAGGGVSSFGTERFRFQYDGQFVASSHINTSGNVFCVDITANRGDGTGVIYFGGAGNRYLYYNGTRYIMPNAALEVVGAVFTGDVTINNNKLSFGSRLGQFLELYSTSYAFGIQDATLYQRSGGNFAWHRGGVHSDTSLAPGSGGTLAMYLDMNNHLLVTGRIYGRGDGSGVGLGKITIQSGGSPPTGAQGDICFIY